MRSVGPALLLLTAAPVAAQQKPATGLTGGYDPANPFARILGGERPASIVHEDADAVVLMPLTMTTPGHVLVIPRRTRGRTLLDLSARELAACMVAVQKAARAQVAALGATGFRVVQNNGADAGQEVFHPHFHVIPVTAPDQPRRAEADRNTRAELDAMAARLRAAWPKD